MQKLKVAVLLGGASNERTISLLTGEQMAKYLDRTQYLVRLYDTKKDLNKLFSDCLNKKIDLCLLALHGKGGEDGTLQGMLDLLGIAYTGSGTLESAVCFDKKATKVFLNSKINLPLPNLPLRKGKGNLEGFNLPKDLIITKGEWAKNKSAVVKNIIKKIGLPCVIKPNASGSSVGVTIAKKRDNIVRGMNLSFKHDKQTLIEQFIKGTEITVPILGDKALPVVEICPKTEFFDYKAKYTPGFSDEIVPARISKQMTEKAQKIALKIHQLLGCSGLTRLDFIMTGEGLYFLEINTIPGMTTASLCPKSANAAGLSFSKLLDQIIKLALKK